MRKTEISKLCKNCGIELREEVQFCPECGARVEEIEIKAQKKKKIF